MKVKKYEKVVSKILLNKFTARNSDYVLYAFVLLEYGVDINTLSTKDFLKGLHNITIVFTFSNKFIITWFAKSFKSCFI